MAKEKGPHRTKGFEAGPKRRVADGLSLRAFVPAVRMDMPPYHNSTPTGVITETETRRIKWVRNHPRATLRVAST